jgi:hypothetical protein
MAFIDFSGYHDEIGTFAQDRFIGEVERLVVSGWHNSLRPLPDLTSDTIFGMAGDAGNYVLGDGRLIDVTTHSVDTVGDETISMKRFRAVVTSPLEQMDDHFTRDHEQYDIEVYDTGRAPAYEASTTLLDGQGRELPDEQDRLHRESARLLRLHLNNPDDEEITEQWHEAMRQVYQLDSAEEAAGQRVFSYVRYGRVMKVLRALGPENLIIIDLEDEG